MVFSKRKRAFGQFANARLRSACDVFYSVLFENDRGDIFMSSGRRFLSLLVTVEFSFKMRLGLSSDAPPKISTRSTIPSLVPFTPIAINSPPV